MREMKRICITFLMYAFVLLSPLFSVTAEASDHIKTFFFELTVDGKDTKEVEPGDIITVVLRLKRVDANEEYTMYAMQDEIRYDSTFFELVEGSAVVSDGISTTDIAMVDRDREFYMNYLSMTGGEKWNPDSLIGSFQLKVVGESGVTKITSEDYLVSLKDGSGSYPCEADELTIILSTDCVVTFRTNGGSEVDDITVQFGEKIPRPENPKREDYELEGWYSDIRLTKKWDFDEDTVEGNMSLYAKWIEVDENQPVSTTDTGYAGYLGYILFLIIILIIVIILIRSLRRKKVGK